MDLMKDTFDTKNKIMNRILFGFLITFLLMPSCAVIDFEKLGEGIKKEFEQNKQEIGNEIKQETFDYLSLALTQKLANTLDFDPLLNISRGKRGLSADQRRNAQRAYQMFYYHSPTVNPVDNTAIHQGVSQTSWDYMTQRVNAVIRRYEVLTDTDIYAIEQAFSPFIDRIQQEIDNPTPIGSVPIYPHQKRMVKFQGYCLDKGIAAPRTEESFQLIPIADLLPEDTAPYYQGLLQYGQRTGNYNEVQGLAWRLVHGVNPEREPSAFNSRQTQILNEAVQGGATGFYSYLERKYDESHNSLRAWYQEYGREEVQKALDKYVNPKFSKSGIVLNMYRRDLNSPAEINDYLYRLSQIPVEGQTEPYSQYTLLTDQVAARSVSTNGVREMTVEFLNTSDEVFYYDPTQYIGFSTRQTQPVGHFPKGETDPELETGVNGMWSLLKENPEYAIGGILAISAAIIAKRPELLAILVASYRLLLGGAAVRIATVITPKIVKQLTRRGWSKNLVEKTVKKPYTVRVAKNRANGNQATAFYRKDGSYVVKDNKTGEIIQVSNRNDPNWIPDSTIVNPYKPN